MMRIQDLVEYLDQVFPAELAADWDNTGFLIGDRHKIMERVLTCLTVTPEVVQEAIREEADMIVSHHPFPFRAAKRWTTDTPGGKMLLDLSAARIGVYSPHTSHDSALYGINEQIAYLLELQEIQTLYPASLQATQAMTRGGDFSGTGSTWEEHPLGTGRFGRIPRQKSIEEFIEQVQSIFGQEIIQAAYHDGHMISTVAIGCGAADEFISQAVAIGADVLLTGESRFHGFLEALAHKIALVAPGHYATERFAMEVLAQRISDVFSNLTVWASRSETDPVRYIVQGRDTL